MIRLKKIGKCFRTTEIETVALNAIDLHVSAGEFVAVTGPSGCGKSTLLNLLGLLDVADSGQYILDGVDVSGFSERRRSTIRKGKIGFVFQEFHLIEDLTIFQNVELPLIYGGVRAGKRKQRIDQVLELIGIAHRRNHWPRQLSGGQQQRAAVARAVVTAPELILADEPTGNLDSENGQAVMDILRTLNQNGTTIVMVTHAAQYAEAADRQIQLLDGAVLSDGTEPAIATARRWEATASVA